MAEQSLKDKTAKGLFWGGVNSIGQQIIYLIFGIFMSRILDPSEFGIVAMLTIFTMIANVLQEGGFYTALINKQYITQLEYSSVFWLNTIVSILLYLLLFYFAPSIAFFYKEPLLIELSQFVFLSVVFNAFGIVQSIILAKAINIRKITIINIVSVFASCTLGLVLALLDFSYWAIASQLIMFPLTKTILLWTTSDWRPSILFSLNCLKPILPFSIGILFSGLIAQLSNNISTLLIGKFYDKNQVGYYSQGNKWYSIPLSIVQGITNMTAHPVLAGVNNEKERQELIFRKMLRFIAFVSFPLILGFAFIAPELIPILVTDKWSFSVPIIQLLCIWGAFLPIWGLYHNILVIRGFSNIILIFTSLHSAMLIITLLFSIQYGIIQMLIWNLLVNFTCLLMMLLIVWKKTGFKLTSFLRDVLPFLGITLFIFLIVYILTVRIDNRVLLIFSKIGISVILYIAIMKFSNVVIFKEITTFFLKKLH